MNWVFQEHIRGWYEAADDESKLVVKEVEDLTEWLAEVYGETVKDEDGDESFDVYWSAGTALSLGEAQNRAERAREILIDLRTLETEGT